MYNTSMMHLVAKLQQESVPNQNAVGRDWMWVQLDLTLSSEELLHFYPIFAV